MTGAAQGPAAEEHGWAYFDLWTWDGTLERIHHALYLCGGSRADGTGGKPGHGDIDSQSVKGAQQGGLLDPQGFDAVCPPRSDSKSYLLKRWIVERTFAWLRRFRRLARDFERYANRRRVHPPRQDPHHAEAARCNLPS